jgi:threonyl-tRNA synthetase
MRDWQLGTIQLDFNMPERFGLEYRNSEGGVSTPVMIHRAVLGSLERFMGILIEHYGGAFPLWLSPMQISVIPVTQDHEAYASKIQKEISDAGYRTEQLPPAESLGFRIRAAQNEKIPYMIVVGDKEIQADKIAVRSRVKGDLGQKSVKEFIESLNTEMVAKGASN